MCDEGLQTEDVAPALFAVLDHAIGDGLELDESAKVGGRRGGYHLGDIFRMQLVDDAEGLEAVSGHTSEPVGAVRY